MARPKTARSGVFGQMNNAVVVEPDQIKRKAHTFHPETGLSRGGVGKEHAVIGGERLAVA